MFVPLIHMRVRAVAGRLCLHGRVLRNPRIDIWKHVWLQMPALLVLHAEAQRSRIIGVDLMCMQTISMYAASH